MNQSLIHWEQRKQIGFFRAFWESLKLSMLEPGRFFDAVPVQGGYTNPLLYGLICMSAGIIFSTLYQFVFQGFGALLQYVAALPMKDIMVGTGFSLLIGVGAIIASPISSFINLFLLSGIYHLFLKMLGSGQNRYEATFRVYAYAQGPQLLQIIPFVGPLVAMVWQYVILVIGFKKLQNASTAQALGAALLPIVLICGLTFFAIFGIVVLIMMVVVAVGRPF